MKSLNLFILGLVLTVFGIFLITSCGEDSVCPPESYQGSWVGGYILEGLIPLPNDDTLIITVSGNTATITSTLAQATFMAEYDASTGNMEIGTFQADVFLVGNDTMFDVSANSGRGELNMDCNTLFITLDKLSIQDGTVDLDIVGGYPINNIDIFTQNNNPFKPI